MYKVYLMTDMTPEEYAENVFEEGTTDLDLEETLEMVGEYTNYVDNALELPNINDKIKDFNKLVGFENWSDEGTFKGKVIYWCESARDLAKALKISRANIGGVDDPIRFDYNDKTYIYDIEELGDNAIVIPFDIYEDIEEVYARTTDKKLSDQLSDVLDYTFS